MIRISARQWVIAITAAVLVHAALAAAMFWRSPELAAMDSVGITVSLTALDGSAYGEARPVESFAEAAREAIAEAAPVAPVEAQSVPDLATEDMPTAPVDVPVMTPAETSVAVATVTPAITEAIPIDPPVEVQTATAPPPESIDIQPLFAHARPKPKPDPPTSRKVEEPPAKPVRDRSETPTTAGNSQAAQNRTEKAATAAAVAPLPGAGGQPDTPAGQAADAGNAVGGGGNPAAVADYYTRLQAWLAKHKRYPRRAKLRNEQGIAILRFVVTPAGEIAESTLEKSSGHSLLDQEARALLRRAQPLPKMPPDMSQNRVELLVPIEFFLR